MTSPSWGSKAGRDAARARAIEEAHRGKALRPRHVVGGIGDHDWWDSQNAAFAERMRRAHPERVHMPRPRNDDGDPHYVAPGWRAPIGSASSLE